MKKGWSRRHARVAILRFAVIGEHDEDDFGSFGAHGAHHVQAAAPREIQVEHDRVRARAQDAGHRGARGGGFADNRHFRQAAERFGEARPDPDGIVHDEYIGGSRGVHEDHCRRRLWRAASAADESHPRRMTRARRYPVLGNP